MFKSTSTSLILLGILAVIVGIIAIAWPSVTILALVILFAVYAFMAAGLQAARAFSSRAAGPVFGHLLLGLIDLAAGVVALAWPGGHGAHAVFSLLWARWPGVFAITGQRQRRPYRARSRYGRPCLRTGTVRLPCAAATATGRTCPADGPGRPP